MPTSGVGPSGAHGAGMAECAHVFIGNTREGVSAYEVGGGWEKQIGERRARKRSVHARVMLIRFVKPQP